MMPVHARKIVREEFEKARLKMVDLPNFQQIWSIDDLAALRARILNRISQECGGQLG